MDSYETAEAEIERSQTEEEAVLFDMLAAAIAVFLATISASQLASTLDDSEPQHIRRQLSLILDLDGSGWPRGIDLTAFDARLANLTRTISQSAAAMAGLTQSDRLPAGGPSDLLSRYREETGAAILTALDKAQSAKGQPFDRAQHLKRSIGLSGNQQAALDTMQRALLAYVNAPKKFTAAERGNPASYTREIDTAALIASTKGNLSAAQRRLVSAAISNPNLSATDANSILDRHANALRRHRIRAAVNNGLHDLVENAKLTIWQAAQQAGFLSSDQRRFWRTAGDERVRHAHAAVPGMNPNGVALNAPFKTPLGNAMTPPLEWGCRCRAILGHAQ